MAKKDLRGKFITFEGSEGCGKSTQSRLLYLFLKRKGFRVLYLREPGGTPISEQLRKILLDAKNEIAAECETLLYMAARAQVMAQVIKPALRKGMIVICDRFLDSTIAYQGYGLGINVDDIIEIGRFATQGIKPDLTIFLDLAVTLGLRHRRGRQDRIEKRPYAYHARVRKGYLKLATLEPGRIKVVQVAEKRKVTQSSIRRVVLHAITRG